MKLSRIVLLICCCEKQSRLQKQAYVRLLGWTGITTSGVVTHPHTYYNEHSQCMQHQNNQEGILFIHVHTLQHAMSGGRMVLGKRNSTLQKIDEYAEGVGYPLRGH